MQTAMFWQAADAGKIACELCPHHCRIADGKRGLCGIRLAQAGQLYAAGYGLISAAHNDPIEKKPLYHFHPGAQIFSVGGWGCNFKCQFCQNWTISQQVDAKAAVPPSKTNSWRFAVNAPNFSVNMAPVATERSNGSSVSPEQIVAGARTEKSIGIAYTYNEPLINLEFVAECARLARAAGLVNVLVTNGYIEKKPAEFILPLIDALNIDIKSMDEEFYKKQCFAALNPVLEFSRQAVAAGCHVEITNLIIPGLNDQDEQIKRLAEWIFANLGEKTPLHLSAYHPEFKMDRPPTPPATLERAYQLCREKLAYVYMGNLFSDSGQNTLCPQCKNQLIVRRGYAARSVGIKGKLCAKCGRPADVVFA